MGERSFKVCNSPSHEGKTNEWLTPRWILEKLGEFDLDPCAYPNWITAKNHYYEGGLEQKWYGRVWLNPPYGRNIHLWLNRLEHHGNGVALVFSRTETKWFQDLNFKAINFLKGRISFISTTNKKSTNAANGSCLIAFGDNNINELLKFDGKIFFGGEL